MISHIRGLFLWIQQEIVNAAKESLSSTICKKWSSFLEASDDGDEVSCRLFPLARRKEAVKEAECWWILYCLAESRMEEEKEASILRS